MKMSTTGLEKRLARQETDALGAARDYRNSHYLSFFFGAAQRSPFLRSVIRVTTSLYDKDGRSRHFSTARDATEKDRRGTERPIPSEVRPRDFGPKASRDQASLYRSRLPALPPVPPGRCLV